MDDTNMSSTVDCSCVGNNSGSATASLVELTRALGSPARGLVIQGEGNTSLRGTTDTTMWVKASGTIMAEANHYDFVEVCLSALAEILDGPELDDDALRNSLAEACLTRGSPAPSIETLLHAVCQHEFGARVVAHTHPMSALGLLCTDRAELLAQRVLLPDQVIVCGASMAVVPYEDPGLPLARRVREELHRCGDRDGAVPRVVWLRNHGLVCLGQNVREVRAATEYAVKVACAVADAVVIGSPSWLTADAVARLDTRDDEAVRRRRLLDSP